MLANVHFQAALHQAKSWKTSSQLNKKDLAKAEAKVEKLEADLADKHKVLEEAQERNVELQDEKKNAIDKYMDIKEFKDLMTAHDSLIYPEYYKDGWDGAIKAILERHPKAFNVADFPYPHATLPQGTYAAEDRMEDEASSEQPSSAFVSSGKEGGGQDKSPSSNFKASSSKASSSMASSSGSGTYNTATSKGGES